MYNYAEEETKEAPLIAPTIEVLGADGEVNKDDFFENKEAKTEKVRKPKFRRSGALTIDE